MKKSHEELSRGLLYFSVLAELDKRDTTGFKRVLERVVAKVRLTIPEDAGENRILADSLQGIERELGDRFRTDFSKFYQPAQFQGYALIALICFLFGASSNFLGPSAEVNLLWNPFTLLLFWNVVVGIIGATSLLLVAGSRVRYRIGRGADAVLTKVQPRASIIHGWGLVGSERLFRWMGINSTRESPALFRKARYVSKLQWLQKHPAIAGKTLSLWLHLWAALFMSGVVFGLFLRGFVKKYQFTWESTFIQSEQTLRGILEFVLKPILWLSGHYFPAGLPELSGDENTAWIILLFLTALIYVILPRLFLAAFSYGQLNSLRAGLDPGKDDPFAQRLLLEIRQSPLQLHIYSFSYQLDQNQIIQLKAGFKKLLPGNLTFSGYQNFAWDDFCPEVNSQSAGPSWLVVCLNGGQTPEPDVHGVFMANILRGIDRNGPGQYVLILIDHQNIDVDRKTKRFEDWQSLLARVDPEISFAWIDLGGDLQSLEIQEQMQDALWSSS